MPSFKEQLKSLDPPEPEARDIVTVLENIQVASTDATMEEAEEIWPILEKTLDPKIGYGLAAIQVGIPKKVGFIRYDGKEYRLLNTKLISGQGEVVMSGEGCLSILGKRVNTKRFTSITVEDDILGRISLNESADGLLTTIFQHEIDHFSGNTILDRKQLPVRRITVKTGRNEPCPCGSGKKYKKCCL